MFRADVIDPVVGTNIGANRGCSVGSLNTSYNCFICLQANSEWQHHSPAPQARVLFHTTLR